MTASTPDALKARVRVAVLMDGPTQPLWIARILTEMLSSSIVDVVGVVWNGGLPVPPRRTLPQRLRNLWQEPANAFFGRYAALDAKLHPASGKDPFGTVDVAPQVAHLPSTVAQPRRTRFSDFFDDAALAFLESLQPDVVIRFGFRILRGRILSVPRHGVWSFHHGDNDVNRGGPAGFWEVMLGWPSTGAILQRLSEDLDGGVTLCRTWVATHPESVNLNRVGLFRAAAPMLMRSLTTLYHQGTETPEPASSGAAFQPYSNRLFLRPSVGELTRGIVRVVSHFVRRKVRAVFAFEQWQLAFAFDPRQPSSHEVPQQSAFRFTRIVPPADRFWADPFPVHADGKSYLFVEELEYRTHKGVITLLEVTPQGVVGTPTVVLEEPHHLSYPFLFQHEGDWFMLVEMASAGATQIVYRASDFPTGWQPHTTFELDQPVADATLHHDGTQWWLFAGVRSSDESPFFALNVYFGDSPFGPWEAHPQNPVVSDARCARPAGRLFHAGPQLIRPAQDSTPTYGKAIVFRRITTLTRDEYREETVSRLEANWAPDLRGTHTINAHGPLTVVDVRALVKGRKIK